MTAPSTTVFAGGSTTEYAANCPTCASLIVLGQGSFVAGEVKVGCRGCYTAFWPDSLLQRAVSSWVPPSVLALVPVVPSRREVEGGAL